MLHCQHRSHPAWCCVLGSSGDGGGDDAGGDDGVSGSGEDTDGGAAADSGEAADSGAAADVDACCNGLEAKVGVVGAGVSVLDSDAGSGNDTSLCIGTGDVGSAGGVIGSGSGESGSSASVRVGATGGEAGEG